HPTAPTGVYTLSLHDALPIFGAGGLRSVGPAARPLARARVMVVGGSLRARVMASALLDPKVSVGTQPTGVAVSASRAYVANQGSDRKSTRLNSSHSQISYAVF